MLSGGHTGPTTWLESNELKPSPLSAKRISTAPLSLGSQAKSARSSPISSQTYVSQLCQSQVLMTLKSPCFMVQIQLWIKIVRPKLGNRKNDEPHEYKEKLCARYKLENKITSTISGIKCRYKKQRELKYSPANLDSPSLPQLNPHFASELPISPSNHPNSEK